MMYTVQETIAMHDALTKKGHTPREAHQHCFGRLKERLKELHPGPCEREAYVASHANHVANHYDREATRLEDEGHTSAVAARQEATKQRALADSARVAYHDAIAALKAAEPLPQVGPYLSLQGHAFLLGHHDDEKNPSAFPVVDEELHQYQIAHNHWIHAQVEAHLKACKIHEGGRS